MKPNIQSKFDQEKLIFLAPMEGITNVAYRNVANRYMDADVICTEFVRLSGDHFNPKQLKDQIKLYDDMILSVQLLGDDPNLFAETIPYFEEIGVEIIDLNLGCPSTLVNRKGCGAAMLKDLKLLETVVSSIRKNCNVTFSCKMRSGWDDEKQSLTIAKIIQENGADYLAIHPRTRLQAYEGKSNWSLIKELKENLSIPVIGNGDIQTPEDAINMIKESNCDGIMVGRGVLRDPMLLNKISKGISTSRNPKELISYKQFYNDYIIEMQKLEIKNINIVNKLKEHYRYFTKFIPNGDEIWNEVKRSDSIEIFTDILETVDFN